MTRALAAALLAAIAAAPRGGEMKIQVKHGTERELRTKAQLEQVLASYDLKKYIFTRDVMIEERATAHAFPQLTLNARFADSPDELLSQFVHEELHWYLRDHDFQQKQAIAELREIYPRVPVGDPDGADSVYSTYGHLVDCYLEILADRELLGEERTKRVIEDKGHYLWIYKTDLQDEERIAGIVERHHLNLN